MGFETNKCGFTLIELVLTFVLLGILAVSAIPFMDTSSSTLDAAVRKVLADIRYAQSLATTTSESYGFQVTGNTTYKVYNVTTGALALSPLTSQPMNEDLNANFRNVRFSQTNYILRFDVAGKTTAGDTLTIILTNGNSTETIIIQPTSGFVELQ